MKRLFLKIRYIVERGLFKIMPKRDSYVRKLDGYSFKFSDKWSYLSALKEIYIDEVYKIHPKISIQSCLDVGANLGFSVAYFKRRFPQAHITAVEADPEIFNFLEANILANDLKSVELIRGAAWVRNEKVMFHQDHSQGGALSEHSTHKSNVMIAAFDLKEIIKSRSWDLLKLDIEGAEAEILQHVSDEIGRFKFIFIEYHESTFEIGRLSGILSLLEENGFKYSVTKVHGTENMFFSYDRKSRFGLQLNIHAVKNDIVLNDYTLK